MKIFVLSQEYPPNSLGGFGTHIVELLDGLARSGVEVVAFTHTFGRAYSSSLGSVVVHRISLKEGRSSGYEFTLADIANLNALVFEAARSQAQISGRPDVLHIHDPVSVEAGLRLKKEFSAQLISSIHLLYKPFLAWWPQAVPELLLEWERKLCVGADQLITVSNCMADLITETYGTSRAKVQVIHNSFSIEGLAHDAASDRIGSLLRRRYVPRAAHIISFAGRLVPMKGLVYLLQSASEVIRACPDVAYLIAGRPTVDAYSREVMKLLDEDPLLKGRVHFVGWLDRRQIGALYTISSVAVVPSLFEPFGYSALEAMACGVPVVATSTGGLAEVVQSVGGGVLVPLITRSDGKREVSPHELAAAQIELLQDPARRARLAKAGRDRSLAQYPLDTMIDQTIRLYEHAASISSPAAR